MWNKFRLWFSKNDSKIFLYTIIVIIVIVTIKGSNSYLKKISQNQNDDSNNTQNSSIFNSVQYEEDDLTQIDSKQDEYNIVKSIGNKFINTVYKATINDDETLKQSVINMCSKRFIDSLTTERRTITTENILDYISKIENESYYSIENIYKYGEKDDISEYVINLKYDDGVTAIVSSYMVIYLDKNNGTFSYDGEYMEFEFINSEGEYYKNIPNNGSNMYK